MAETLGNWAFSLNSITTTLFLSLFQKLISQRESSLSLECLFSKTFEDFQISINIFGNDDSNEFSLIRDRI